MEVIDEIVDQKHVPEAIEGPPPAARSEKKRAKQQEDIQVSSIDEGTLPVA